MPAVCPALKSQTQKVQSSPRAHGLVQGKTGAQFWSLTVGRGKSKTLSMWGRQQGM